MYSSAVKVKRMRKVRASRRSTRKISRGLAVSILQEWKRVRVQRRIYRFRKWCNQVGIDPHPHVYITQEGTCDAVGVVATASISEGECVAVIPRAAILCCANVHSVADRIRQDHTLQSDSTSSWLPLLLTLAAETSKNTMTQRSRWQPYLSLVPSHSNPVPMLWAESVRSKYLEGTSVDRWVKCDQQRMRADYDKLAVPFMTNNQDLFSCGVCSYQEFEKLTAFVMAYSFTDEGAGFLGETVMVPFVDLLNHSSRHHVELTFHPSHLKLRAVRNIEKGEELMNTYGALSNAELLHKYGFTEPDNPNDEVVIPSAVLREVYRTSGSSSSSHWDKLTHKVEEEYCVGLDGTPSVDLLELVHHLVTPTCRRRRSLPTNLRRCTEEELQLIIRLAKHCLAALPQQVTDDSTSSLPVSAKAKFSLYLIQGQQIALRRLLKKTSTILQLRKDKQKLKKNF